MWRILKAEIRYNWLNFVFFLAIVPVPLVAEIRYGTGYPIFFAFILMLLMVNGWNVRYIQEKRDYQYTQLPVTAKTVAAARILMVLLACSAYVAWFVGLHIALMPSAHVNPRGPLAVWGILVIAYSLGFIFRDRFIGTKALMRGKMLLVILLGGTALLNLGVMLAVNRAKATGAPMPWLAKVFELIERNNPASSNLNTALWLAVSLVLAYATVETYARRRSQA
jgi:hypothetical protein